MKRPRRQFLHLAAGAAAVPIVSRIAKAQAYPERATDLWSDAQSCDKRGDGKMGRNMQFAIRAFQRNGARRSVHSLARQTCRNFYRPSGDLQLIRVRHA